MTVSLKNKKSHSRVYRRRSSHNNVISKTYINSYIDKRINQRFDILEKPNKLATEISEFNNNLQQYNRDERIRTVAILTGLCIVFVGIMLYEK
jgi:hypothetical protein